MESATPGTLLGSFLSILSGLEGALGENYLFIGLEPAVLLLLVDGGALCRGEL